MNRLQLKTCGRTGCDGTCDACQDLCDVGPWKLESCVHPDEAERSLYASRVSLGLISHDPE